MGGKEPQSRREMASIGTGLPCANFGSEDAWKGQPYLSVQKTVFTEVGAFSDEDGGAWKGKGSLSINAIPQLDSM